MYVPKKIIWPNNTLSWTNFESNKFLVKSMFIYKKNHKWTKPFTTFLVVCMEWDCLYGLQLFTIVCMFATGCMDCMACLYGMELFVLNATPPSMGYNYVLDYRGAC